MPKCAALVASLYSLTVRYRAPLYAISNQRETGGPRPLPGHREGEIRKQRGRESRKAKELALREPRPKDSLSGVGRSSRTHG